jgi:nitric-oxide synthase
MYANPVDDVPLPVGKVPSQWYRYQELIEEEEELRPKWHY